MSSPTLFRRFIAVLIDAAAIWCLLALVSRFAPWLFPDLHGEMLFFLCWLCMDVVLTALACTPGQWLTGFRVRDARTGLRVRLPVAFKRGLAKQFLGGLSLYFVTVRRDRRALHDLFAGTCTVRTGSHSGHATV